VKKVLPICVFFFFASLNFLQAQAPADSLSKSDSIARAKRHKKLIYSGPRKASIMSAVLPGLGQIYNKKYWKLPIIYGGIGGFGYMFMVNNTQYNYYRKHLIAEYDGNPDTQNTSGYTGDQLQTLKQDYRRYRDFGAMGMGIIYILNIIDANVDAHLKTFDVSDDLSIRIVPKYEIYTTSLGLTPVAGLSFKLILR
jgi:hypothetical protein